MLTLICAFALAAASPTLLSPAYALSLTQPAVHNNNCRKNPTRMGDCPQDYTRYTRFQTNINSLLRELSGPQPLRRGPDIISKPLIWDT
jgi:hypothetical protein